MQKKFNTQTRPATKNKQEYSHGKKYIKINRKWTETNEVVECEKKQNPRKSK